MTLRNLTLLLAGGFGTIALVSTAVTVAALLDNRQLRREAQEARREENRARAETRRLEEERGDVASQDERLRTLESELAALRSDPSTNAAPTAAPASPVRARLFVNQQYVGLGWIVPGAATKDPGTGRIGYEPVVLLDESVRNTVGISKTNVVEREVVRPTTVNYNYAYPYGYGGWWPVYWVAPASGSTNRPPKPPRVLLPPRPTPHEGQPFLSTRFYLPTETPFLPPVPHSARIPLGGGAMNGGYTASSGGNLASANRLGPVLGTRSN